FDIDTGIDSILFPRGGNTASPKGVLMDELRVDTSWSQVTPPAGSNWGGGSGTWSSSLPNAAGNFVNFAAGGGAVNVDASGRSVGNNGTVAITSESALGPAPLSPATNVTVNRAVLRFDSPMSTDVNRNLALFPITYSIDLGGTLDTNGNNVTFNGVISGRNLH